MTVLSKPAHEMTFVPRPLVVVQVRRLQVSLYPVVDPSMSVFERAHAFQVAKSALKELPIDKRQILDALGAQLYCSAIVDGLVHDWRYLFDSTWFNFTQLMIVSFHNSAGTQINNTTIAGNATILLPVMMETWRIVASPTSVSFASHLTSIFPALFVCRPTAPSCYP